MKEISIEKKILGVLGAFFLISPNLNILESIFRYCGMEPHSTVRLVAAVCFAVIDLLVGLAFLKSRPTLKMFLAVIIFNVIYIMPLVLTWDSTEILQYVLFVVPVTMIALSLARDSEIRQVFFTAMKYITRVLIVLAIVYIILQYVGTDRNAYGMLVIKNMTYGDMAYLFLPGFVMCMIECTEKKSVIGYIGLVVFSLAILFAGARSAVLCIFCAIILFWIILLFSKAKGKQYLAILLVTVVTGASLLGGMFILPEGSRLDVLNISFKSDDFSENIVYEATRVPQARTIVVIYTPTGEERKLYDIYREEIINSDRPKTETEKILRADVYYNTKEYIELISEDDRAKAEIYRLSMNRDFLWKSAYAEFKKHPVTGNGPCYYKNKYDGFFPHNVFLEAMTDYGVIGLIIISALGAYCFIYGLIYYIRTRDKHIFWMLLLLFAYFPGYMLYTTIYSNSTLALTIIFFTALGKLKGNEVKDPKLDK